MVIMAYMDKSPIESHRKHVDFPACAGMSQGDRHFVDDCSFGAKAYGTLGTPQMNFPFFAGCPASSFNYFKIFQDISRSFVENHNFH